MKTSGARTSAFVGILALEEGGTAQPEGSLGGGGGQGDSTQGRQRVQIWRCELFTLLPNPTHGELTSTVVPRDSRFTEGPGFGRMRSPSDERSVRRNLEKTGETAVVLFRD